MNVLSIAIATIILISSFYLTDVHAAGAPAPEQKVTPAPIVEKQVRADIANMSVLERFRTYSGKRTPAALTELFAMPVSFRVHQQPEIALSSGAVTVSILVVLNTANNSSPNFALNGARLLSYVQAKADSWLIETLPDAGVWKAEMVVLTDAASIEVPLVVAPPLPAETDLSEKGFIEFLGGKVTAPLPQRDLNGDGRRDYLDDYIFTANYLVRKSNIESEPEGATQPAVPDERTGDQVNRQQETAAGTNPGLLRTDPASNAVTQTPAKGPAVDPVFANTIKPDGTVDRKAYNSLTYDQRKKLREDQARKNKLNTSPQGQ